VCDLLFRADLGSRAPEAWESGTERGCGGSGIHSGGSGIHSTGGGSESCDREPSSATKEQATGLSLHSPNAVMCVQDTCPVLGHREGMLGREVLLSSWAPVELSV
jgi:hypothetical protein